VVWTSEEHGLADVEGEAHLLDARQEAAQRPTSPPNERDRSWLQHAHKRSA
jgi:hypothetical protein